MGPVLITADGDLQEDPIPPEVEKRLKIPALKGIRSQPSGDVSAVREAAKMLVAAENPVIFTYRYARTEAAPALLVQLAELLHAPVVDGRGRMNIPNKHPLNHTTRREAALRRSRSHPCARTGRCVTGLTTNIPGHRAPAEHAGAAPTQSEDHPDRRGNA